MSDVMIWVKSQKDAAPRKARVRSIYVERGRQAEMVGSLPLTPFEWPGTTLTGIDRSGSGEVWVITEEG